MQLISPGSHKLSGQKQNANFLTYKLRHPHSLLPYCFHKKSLDNSVGSYCSFWTVTKYSQHKIYYFNHLKMYSSVSLSTFTLLGHHHHYLPPELFHLLKPKLRYHLTKSPLTPHLYLLVTIQLSISMNLIILGTTYKWNYILYIYTHTQ